MWVKPPDVPKKKRMLKSEDDDNNNLIEEKQKVNCMMILLYFRHVTFSRNDSKLTKCIKISLLYFCYCMSNRHLTG